MRRFLAIAFSLILIGSVIAALQIGRFAVTPLDSKAKNQKAILTVQKGMRPREIAERLALLGVIDDAEEFLWVGRILRRWSGLKIGEYEVSPTLTPLEIYARLNSGISVAHPITIKEGDNMYQVADAIAAAGLATRAQMLKLFKDRSLLSKYGIPAPLPPSFEGYLYPETYFFNRTTLPEEMLKQMTKLALAQWKPEYDTRARALGMTRLEVITLASIVEKETGAPQERPLISAVFHNRLKKKMRLQTDPTAIYGIWEQYDGNIHRSTLRAMNPYNTYTILGLPPGPISNPSLAAIEAALYPADVPYLYFVSRNDGTHVFSTSLSEHNAGVRKFQLDPKAREGKSWRDLNKKKSIATPDSEI